MIAMILGFLLKLAGSTAVDKVLGHLQTKANSETERLRIETLRQTTMAGYSRDVIVAGMGHSMYWVAWSMAALPMAGWFGWGMLDTWANGALPDVAAIPAGLQPWAATVWNSLFYSGAGLAGTQIVASALARKK